MGRRYLCGGLPSVWAYGATTGVVDDGVQVGRTRLASLAMRPLVLAISRCSSAMRWLIFRTPFGEAVALAPFSESMRAVRLVITLFKRAVRAATRAGECDDSHEFAAWWLASWLASWTMLDDGMLLDDGTLLEVCGWSSTPPRPVPAPNAVAPPWAIRPSDNVTTATFDVNFMMSPSVDVRR